jgi:hypothetical protein
MVRARAPLGKVVRRRRLAMSKISLETLLCDPDLVEQGRRAFDLVWRLHDAVYPHELAVCEAARDTLWELLTHAAYEENVHLGSTFQKNVQNRTIPNLWRIAKT